jgi:hypothetical protein
MKPLPFIDRCAFEQASAINYSAQKRAAHRIQNKTITDKINSRPKHVNDIKLQIGDMLIEALIGLVLMAIVAVGVTTITSKVEKGKREMSVQDLAVSQLQELLVKNGNGTLDLCDGTPETIILPDETITVDPSGCTKVVATINGVALTDLKQPIVLTATSTKNSAVYTVGGISAQ